MDNKLESIITRMVGKSWFFYSSHLFCIHWWTFLSKGTKLSLAYIIFFKNIDLFIWLSQVFLASRSSAVSYRHVNSLAALLSSPTRGQTPVLHIARQILNHWTTRKSLIYITFMEVVGTLSCYLWCKLCVHAQSCPTLCNSMDCSLPGSFVHRIFQARILEWVAISYSTDISYFHLYLIYNNLIKACEIRSAIRNIKIVGMWVLASPFFFFFNYSTTVYMISLISAAYYPGEQIL